MLDRNVTYNQLSPFENHFDDENLDLLFQMLLYRNLDDDRVFVNVESLIIFSPSQRIALFVANLIIFSIAIIGNVSVILVNSQRKMRYFYKYCLISCGLSDLMMTTFAGIEHMTTLSENMFIWHLGPFLCKFVPFMEITSLIANSMTLTCIAIDRYQSIVNAFQFKWNPQPFMCYISVVGMWIFSAALAFPLLLSYDCLDLTAVQMNETGNLESYDVQRCVLVLSKRKATYYFGSLFMFIFLPLLITFLWLYINVATMIWSRTRQPPAPRNEQRVGNESSTTESTNIECKPSSANSTTTCANAYCRMHYNYVISKHNLERKLRTFKVILLLMIVFLICRLPLWIFMVVQMALVLNKRCHWYIAFGLNLIAFSNSAFNPFLYTFLNETIVCGEKFLKFTSTLFCTCCKTRDASSNDFIPNNNICRQHENIVRIQSSL